MAKHVGANLPQELLDTLTHGLLFRGGGLGLTVLTLDPLGWPHVAMAPGAVAAGPDAVYILLGGQSGSLQNLQRDGRVTLLLAAPDLLYYVKGRAEIVRPEMQVMAQEAAVRVRVTEVLCDMEPFLTVTSGLSYRYKLMHEDFTTVIGAMLDELQSLAEEN